MIIDRHGVPYVLETNTIPGLTSQSLFPKAAKVAGYMWPQLIAKFVELAKG
jgi:D-alanine-D-alanine ligase